MDRLLRTRALLERDQLEALLISTPENRRYLSGFTGSAGFLVVTHDRTLLISDGRYAIQAGQEAPAWDYKRIMPPALPLTDVLQAEFVDQGVRRVGFEAAHLTVAQFDVLTKALPGIEWVPTEGLIETLREQKDASELGLLTEAIAITDRAFARIQFALRPTMREREAAWEIELALHAEGASGLAFPVTVAAGLHSAKPHARPGDELLGVGRPIIMDFGALYRGYHGDMTRTVILGESTEHFDRVYNLVHEVQQHAAQSVCVGMSGHDADALARDRFEAAGYGEQFMHSLGHGVGLAIHEGPSLRKSIEAPLPAGSVVSIEPGLYLPDWGGVRIEDLVLLEAQGPRTLTQATKELLVISDQ